MFRAQVMGRLYTAKGEYLEQAEISGAFDQALQMAQTAKLDTTGDLRSFALDLRRAGADASNGTGCVETQRGFEICAETVGDFAGELEGDPAGMPITVLVNQLTATAVDTFGSGQRLDHFGFGNGMRIVPPRRPRW